MRVALVVGCVLLGLVGTVVPPAVSAHPLTWLALCAGGWTAGALVTLRACLSVSRGPGPTAWPRTLLGVWALSWMAGAAATMLFDSPLTAAFLLVAGPAALHVAVAAADTVALTRPPETARPHDVPLMMQLDPRREESEAAMAGLAAGMVVAAASWVSVVFGAGLQLVAPWWSLYLGVLVGALVAAVRAARCLPAALRLQHAVTAGRRTDHARLLRAARHPQASVLAPELLPLLPLWAARALAVSALMRAIAAPALVAVVALEGLFLLAVAPIPLTAVALVAALLVGLAIAPRSRRRHDDLLARAAAHPVTTPHPT